MSAHSLGSSGPPEPSGHSSGPAMSASPIEFVYELNPHLNGEDLEMYKIGGLRPIEIDQMIRGNLHTYRIIHKLGYGGFSTVWIAQASGRLYSMKFVSARSSNNGHEEDIMRALNSATDVAPHVAHLVESFVIDGPNCAHGTSHKVLVLELLGPSIARLSYGRTRLLPGVMRTIMYKIAAALYKLHLKGIVHRDLNPRNILLKLSDGVLSASRDAFIRTYGDPSRRPVTRLDGAPPAPRAPKYCYEAIDFARSPANVLHEPAIIDFGESNWCRNVPSTRLGVPPAFAAPEVLLENSVSSASDIWSLGCIIYGARSGDLMFSGDSESDAVFSMICTLASPPKPAWQRVKFDAAGFAIISSLHGSSRRGIDNVDTIRNLDPQLRTPLKSKISAIHDRPSHKSHNGLFWGTGEEAYDYEVGQYPSIHAAEAQALYDLLSRIFVWDPQRRLTAAQVMQHPWFHM